MKSSLKVTYLFPQSTYWPSVFGKGDAQNAVFLVHVTPLKYTVWDLFLCSVNGLLLAFPALGI